MRFNVYTSSLFQLTFKFLVKFFVETVFQFIFVIYTFVNTPLLCKTLDFAEFNFANCRNFVENANVIRREKWNLFVRF